MKRPSSGRCSRPGPTTGRPLNQSEAADTGLRKGNNTMKRIKIALALLAVAAVAATALGSSASASTPSRTGSLQNIVDTATAAGNFTTLVSLVTQAGLADTLANGGPFTVFAPTDAAFAKVPKATLNALAANPALLKAVLLYHVLPGSLTAAAGGKLT